MSSRARKTAVILAGGVAKGAFEAGALSVLAERGVEVMRVVGASSGALNGIMYAGAIRSGRQVDATRRLMQLWLDDADWMHVFHFSPHDVLQRRALSDSTRIYKLMRDELPSILTARVNDVQLQIVVGAANGKRGNIGREPATTFEAVLAFSAADFDDAERREAMYNAAAASTAFPVLFGPIDLPTLGPCYDGGVVNDTPVRAAAAEGAERIFVIAPYPTLLENTKLPRGIDLVMHLVEIIVHERLYRDLYEAARLNDVVARIMALVDTRELSAMQAHKILTILDASLVELVPIRPEASVAGNSFSGFIDRQLRVDYVEAGRAAAERALAAMRP
jgi:NTE family protein